MATGMPVTLSLRPAQDNSLDSGSPEDYYGNLSDYGPRGDTSLKCYTWFRVLPGAYFQVGCVLLCLSFMGGGRNQVAAVYRHILSMFAFLAYATWGYINTCSPDIVAWSVIITLVNMIQAAFLLARSSKIRQLMETNGMQELYSSRFSILEVAPQLFMDLVTCKGCEQNHLEKGKLYASERKTSANRLSLLLSGRMSVSCNGKFLHFITSNSFIDSPEWNSVANSDQAQVSYKVTIMADTDCKLLTWRRKGLISLFSKQKKLKKIVNSMIARDVTEKLYGLNDRCITERGFRYDIRLPCVISLPEDMERRNKAQSQSAPGSPMDGRRKHKRLGKTAAAKYAKVLATKLRARRSLRQPRPLIETGKQ